MKTALAMFLVLSIGDIGGTRTYGIIVYSLIDRRTLRAHSGLYCVGRMAAF